jgi:hypothetical protein
MENSESSCARRSTDSAYVLDNAGKEAPNRLTAPSAAFDPGTICYLQDLGVGSG